METRLLQSDEFMHPIEEAPNFNESMYFNVFDPRRRCGGFFRLGNRPNEGHAELTTCIFTPDGSVAFMFCRPSIASNDTFAAGGMKFEVIEPFKTLDLSYTGRVLVLKNPLEMVDPRQAFSANPFADCEVRLRYVGVSPMYGGEPVAGPDLVGGGQDTDNAFARGHYEQHVAANGLIRVGRSSWEVQGWGLRDHSWGPRYWQAPWYYRWLTANFGEDRGFMISVVTARNGTERVGGMVLRDGGYDLVDAVTLSSRWAGEERYHQSLAVEVRTRSGRNYLVEGRVMSLIPLRNRRQDDSGEQLVTRISEGMTEWSWDGRRGYGMSEYLDQIVDGRPVGAG